MHTIKFKNLLSNYDFESILSHMKAKERIKPYLYITPAVVLALTFTGIPFLRAFIDSFLKINPSGSISGFAGLSNYKQLFSDSGFLNAVKRTLLFASLFVPLNTLLTVLAAALTRRKNRYSFIPEYIFFMPMAFSLSAATLLFKQMFRGQVSIVNRTLNLDIGWLSEAMPAMLVLVFLGIFLDFGIDYIILLSAFRSVDKSIIEAAKLDGATGSRLFFSIELPMAKNMVIVTIFLALKDALLIVAPVTILTEGGPFRSTETVMFYYYIEAFKSGNMAIGNTITVITVGISILIMALAMKKRRSA